MKKGMAGLTCAAGANMVTDGGASVMNPLTVPI